MNQCSHIVRRRGEEHRCNLPDGHWQLHQAAPIRFESYKRRWERRQYRDLRAAFLTGHPICQLCEEAASTEVHHMKGRVGSLYLDVDHWKALCRNCHQWATENPEQAKKCGISANRVGA